MFFTWLPQLGKHIVEQYMKSWVAVVLGIGITAAVPWFTLPIVKDAMDTDITATWMYGHVLFMGFCFIGVFILHELGSAIHFMWFLRNHNRTHPSITVVRRIAEKGMLRHTPRILETGDKQTNAGALTSFVCGHYIIFAGKALKVLNERQQETVIAHEIAHIKHGDRMGRLVFGMTAGMTYVYMAAFCAWGLFGGILNLITIPESIQFLKAALVIMLLRMFLTMIELSYWRAREYLADAAAIALTGWEYRFDFIRALDKLAVENSIWLPDWFLYWWPEFLRDHPRNINRAKVFGIELTYKE